MSSLARKIKRHGISKPKRAAPFKGEKLEAVAIMRGGVLHRFGMRGGHWQVRLALGDDEPNRSAPGDIEGFVTTTGRFVDRAEAQDVALAAGQIRDKQRRDLLSSDIDW